MQISDGNGDAHLVHFPEKKYDCPNLKKILSDNNRTVIFHYARFDIAAIDIYLDVNITNIYCTKIVSKLARTYTDKHSLKELCKELAGVDLSKQQQCSDWGVDKLSEEQVNYAASDVLYLHKIRAKLNEILYNEGREEIAQKCFDFLPTRVMLDKLGWADLDIFHH